MLVEGIVHVGLISSLADTLLSATGGDATVATLGLLWLSGIASAIVDNIPYTATMIPLVEQLGQSGLPKEPLVWSLALGADLGGNATIVGASANVVVANVAARAGHPISFGHFLRYGSIIVVESLLISSVYLWLRFLA
jgi:Na+/H+ antiporter NhaD/arsenite permease-like protein